jgi:hypothetical protein
VGVLRTRESPPQWYYQTYISPVHGKNIPTMEVKYPSHMCGIRVLNDMTIVETPQVPLVADSGDLCIGFFRLYHKSE